MVFKTGYSARMESTSISNKTDSINTEPEYSDKITTTNKDDSANKESENGGYEDSKEPTRYGDWEIAGRCIDF